MEKKLYDEMVANLDSIIDEGILSSADIFLFGHCNATLELIDLLESKKYYPMAILDNSRDKQGIKYKGVKVVFPGDIIEKTIDDKERNSIVLITSRFYSAMSKQLREIGYKGQIRKLIDYNTYSDYSLSQETFSRMTAREKQGEDLLGKLSDKYPGYYKIFCPFNALGDIYLMASYFPAFAEKRGVDKAVFCLMSAVLADVIHLFDCTYNVEVYEQNELDAMIQAALYTKDEESFIAHQDRPYVINLNKALYVKKIPLDLIYCCGVYGLPKDTIPDTPKCFADYRGIEDIPQGKAVIFSPYAKSVPSIANELWQEAVEYYSATGYSCYTNVINDEIPLTGTKAISPTITEMKSVVERAGTFIGIRSGLCDVLREAKAKKIALYPDYFYCDTRWKAIDMYYLDQFDHNIVVTEKIEWEKL